MYFGPGDGSCYSTGIATTLTEQAPPICCHCSRLISNRSNISEISTPEVCTAKATKVLPLYSPLGGELSLNQDLTGRLNIRTIRSMSLHSMMAKRLAPGYYLELPSTPVFSQMICDADCKSANNAIHLNRPLMVSFGIPGIRRPGDGKR